MFFLRIPLYIVFTYVQNNIPVCNACMPVFLFMHIYICVRLNVLGPCTVCKVCAEPRSSLYPDKGSAASGGVKSVVRLGQCGGYSDSISNRVG